MRVMDLSSRRPPLGVRIMALPSCELVTSLYVFLHMEERDAMVVGKEWFDAIRASLSPDLQAELHAYGLGLAKGWMLLWPWQGESTAESTCELFLARLKAADPIALRLAMLERPERRADTVEDAAVIARAASGDASALATCLEAAGECAEDMSPELLRARLLVDPDQDKQRLIRLLTGWYEQVLRNREAELTVILERDAARTRRLALRHTPLRQIELVTNGLQYTPEPGITRVLLVPSVACRPWVLIGAFGETKTFTYAVAEESLSEDSEASTTHLLTVFKALADERRLSALRLLSERGATLQELADALGVGKSLMHHHMIVLRAAGLVSVQLSGDRRYEIRREALATLPDLLQACLAARGAWPSTPS